jgi:phage tail sheath protein FI
VQIVEGAAIEFDVDPTAHKLTITRPADTAGSAIAASWTTWAASEEAGGFVVAPHNNGDAHVATVAETRLVKPTNQPSPETLAAIQMSDKTALYNQVKAAMANQRVVLPPSPAIAGVYATVDRTRGVWKAPANVSLASVIRPMVKITDAQQEGLNVDPTSGKSINAIRAFTGKGTLVWGARTLAGNDNEWRYINVRRLFSVIEESIQKATAFAVFEANDTTTWLKVKAMIESYLYGLWERGALAGPTPEAAYFVEVGLGKTMTNQDILEGRMNVRVGIAAVRPAEFIIVTFTHKLQEA